MAELLQSNGGKLIFDPDGTSTEPVDAVIAVYGEDPYAEFQGDLPNVDFKPQGFDTSKLKTYQQRGIKTVSVFLSGRPLWTNPEINGSDAFVAAWLPGSEGGGISDMLFRTDATYEFTGRLSYSWPKRPDQAQLNQYHDNYDPLFPLGFGLGYASRESLATLPEDYPGAEASDPNIITVFARGALGSEFSFGTPPGVDTIPFENGQLSVRSVDKDAQEDAIGISFLNNESTLQITANEPLDLLSQINVTPQLSFGALGHPTQDVDVEIGLDCASCKPYSMTLRAGWNRYRIAMNCFTKQRDDLASVQALTLKASQVAISRWPTSV